MRRAVGIGGIMFKAKDPQALTQWYQTHLGLKVESWGGVVFRWDDDKLGAGATAWTPFKQETTYFAPGTSNFMINFRVEDLDALLVALHEEGCQASEKADDSEFGKFGWVIDPEGNKVELWQPPAEKPGA